MKLLNLPDIISNATLVCGTAFEWENREIERVKNIFIQGFKRAANKWVPPDVIKIENMDCLKLLRNYL